MAVKGHRNGQKHKETELTTTWPKAGSKPTLTEARRLTKSSR